MRGLAPTKRGVSRTAACDKRESSIAKPEFRNRLFKIVHLTGKGKTIILFELQNILWNRETRYV